jgi:hypothetical protein
VQFHKEKLAKREFFAFFAVKAFNRDVRRDAAECAEKGYSLRKKRLLGTTTELGVILREAVVRVANDSTVEGSPLVVVARVRLRNFP